LEVIQRIVPKSVKNVRPGGTMTPQYITIHETDNTKKGADAEAHANYAINGAGGATKGWHFTVDDKSIYQHLPTNEHGWHAGDGGNGTGNRKSIGIEICVNSDGDFAKACDNAAWLVRKLMSEHNIPISRVVQHNHWSGKNCPRTLRKGGWRDFIAKVEGVKVEKVKSETGTAKLKSSLLKRGDKGHAVKDFQMKLIKAGEKLPKFGADGHFGDETYRAVTSFQKRHGLVVDGIVGPKTRAKMDEVLSKKTKAKYPLPSGVYRRGDRGTAVKQIQTALNAANFKCGAVDGIYGPKTEDAVIRFQKVYLPHEVDGVYGPNTRRELNKVVN